MFVHFFAQIVPTGWQAAALHGTANTAAKIGQKAEMFAVCSQSAAASLFNMSPH